MSDDNTQFWQTKDLAELNPQEWESLCDGCGKCCVLRFQDEDTEQIYATDVVCRYLDLDDVRCTCYANRREKVPECLVVTPSLATREWLPDTCAYRLLAQGEALPVWHPLLSGSRESVYEYGVSIKGKVVSEAGIHPDDIEERILQD